MWMPLSESTRSDIWPTSRAKAASSNCFCMAPRPNIPRSPLLAALPHSEYSLAILFQSSWLLIASLNLMMLSMASCLDRVTGRLR